MPEVQHAIYCVSHPPPASRTGGAAADLTGYGGTHRALGTSWQTSREHGRGFRHRLQRRGILSWNWKGSSIMSKLTDEQREAIAAKWRGRNWTLGDIMDAVEA